MSGEERYADLHLHSNCSDGVDAPARVVERAAELGFALIALTDHDTVQGIAEARKAGAVHGVEILTGIEISAGAHGHEVHVLGYGIDPENDELRSILDRLAIERVQRAERIVQKLNDAGLAIELENVRARGEGVLGRMHVAQELLALGHATTVQNAFDRYLKAKRPGYVPKPLLGIAESIALIHRAGGVAFHAHPGIGRQGKRLQERLDAGFDGIEVFHSKHTPEQIAKFLQMAESKGFQVSGGSDCHGEAKGKRTEMGRVKLPWQYVEHILEQLGNVGETR